MNLVKKDDYYTPKWVWEEIAPFLKKNGVKRIYEPFNNILQDTSLNSRRTLEFLDFEVLKTRPYNPLTEENSFFTNIIDPDSYDAIVSNIPFSKKKWIIEHLICLDKPFCILIPPYAICAKYFKKFKNQKDLGIIIPSNRIDFKTAENPNQKSRWEGLWVTYKMGGELEWLK